MSAALILTYHAIEPGPAPLCLAPSRFRDHLDVIAEAAAEAITISALAEHLRAGRPLDGRVAITFDDGFASVPRTAAPLLAERGMSATVFCVAGHLGGENDWPTQPERAPRRGLASGDELAALAAAGFEVGSHGVEHAPLDRAAEEVVRRELLDSKEMLQGAVGQPVTTLAYPYGVQPGPTGRALTESSYLAACTGRMSPLSPSDDRFALPRVDAHYLRRPELLRRALRGSLGPYLRLRRAGGRARRIVRSDYVDSTR